MNRLLITFTLLACLVAASMQQEAGEDTCFTTDCKVDGEIIPENDAEEFGNGVCKAIEDFKDCLETKDSCKENDAAKAQLVKLSEALDEKCAGSFVQGSVLLVSLALFLASRFQ